MRERTAVASRIFPLLLACAAIHGAAPRMQEATPAAEYVAFRFDDEHVIATVKVYEDESIRQVTTGLSPEPAARYGFRYFEPPARMREKIPPLVLSATSWVVHAAPRQAFDATAERIVGGNAQCSEAVGVLLRIAPQQASAFAGIRTRYFVAEPSEGATASAPFSSPALGMVVPALTVEQRTGLESTLNELLKRELPRIRAESDALLERMATSAKSSHRRDAAERRRIDEAVASGHGALSYDVQAFRLGPGDERAYFVRAEWRVNARLGFVAAVWLRGERLEIVAQDLEPASWLRMPAFQGRVGRSRLGLILAVLDRDRDGWAEILFAQEGYEGVSIELLEYSPQGFAPTGLTFAQGC